MTYTYISNLTFMKASRFNLASGCLRLSAAEAAALALFLNAESALNNVPRAVWLATGASRASAKRASGARARDPIASSKILDWK